MLRALAIVALALTGMAAQEKPPAPEKIQLRVLYAGKPESPREKEFVALLGGHFAEVGTIHLGSACSAKAKDWDVVVLDWISIYPRDEQGKTIPNKGISMPPVKLDAAFSRATVMIGAAAGTVGGSLKLKTDWL